MTFTLHARFEFPAVLIVRTPKTLVYTAPFDNEETLHHRTVDACQTIGNHRDISERLWRSMMRDVSRRA
jgi:hypothetical protein